ncbi:MAG: disulfide bond formation protein B [Alphaproteobacteria bacterium]
MTNMLLKLLSRPVAVLAGLTAISVVSLLAALGSEVFLGLEPCILCVYQRFPYLAVIVFGTAGLALKKRFPPLPRLMIGVSGVTFLINSGIAFYHTGVEQKWWKSAVEGCAVPHFRDEPQSILENILSAPTANCAEIPWQDPILGLSMANYNVLLCFGLAVVCALSVYLLRRTHKG